MEKFKKVLLFLIVLYFSRIFIEHGFEKFDADGFWSSAFIKKWGYGLYFMYTIGFIEFTSAIGMLIPKVNKYAAFMLGLVMIGAVVTRIIYGTSIDDVISILFNACVLFYVSLVYGIGDILIKLKNR